MSVSRARALPPYIIDPIWEQFRALLPQREVDHPLRTHQLEDPCAQRTPRRRSGIRRLVGFRRRRAQRGGMARGALSRPRRGPHRWAGGVGRAAQWWLLLHLLRRYGLLLRRVEALEGEEPLEALPVGEVAPDFELPDLHGEALTLESLRAPERPLILLFVDPQCGPCKELFPDVGHWQTEHSDKLSVAFVSRGEPEENATMALEHDLTDVLLQEDWEVADAYHVDGTPSAVLVRPDGTIGSSALEGVHDVRTFLVRTIEEPAQLRP
jgi:methylamine dehydrogenase accessory protein MauD